MGLKESYLASRYPITIYDELLVKITGHLVQFCLQLTQNFVWQSDGVKFGPETPIMYTTHTRHSGSRLKGSPPSISIPKHEVKIKKGAHLRIQT